MINRTTTGTTPGTTSGDAGPRIRHEQRTIDAMLDIYCRDHHGSTDALCTDCARLRIYAHQRLDACPFQEEKPVCNRCEVHCYSVPRRKQVRQVMRYAGPRMPLRHPWLSFRHMLDKLRQVPSLARFSDRTERAHRQRTGSDVDTESHTARTGANDQT